MLSVHPVPTASFGSIPRDAERLIVAGRSVLAVVAALAVGLDPVLPADPSWLTDALLGAYLVGSVVLLALMAWYARIPQHVIAWSGFSLDVLCLGAVVFLTGELASPLYMLTTFTVVTAAYRWRVRGALWGFAATTGAILLGDAYELLVLGVDPFGNAYALAVMRIAGQLVLAVILGHLGEQAAERRRHIADVSGMRRAAVHDLQMLLDDALRRAIEPLDATRLVTVWEDPDEPWLHVASFADDRLLMWREPPGLFGSLTDESLHHDDFVVEDASARHPMVLMASLPAPIGLAGRAIDPDLVQRFAFQRVLALRLRGDIVNGRLFVEASRPLSADDIVLGRLVAGQIAGSLDMHLMSRRLRELATLEERHRVSRELHDGMLQSLTGAALTLQAATQKLDGDPAATRALLESLQQLLLGEQRDLRLYLQHLASDNAEAADDDRSLQGRMRTLVHRLETIWRVRVHVTVAPAAADAADRDVHELFRLTQEAVTNAARHGGASEVTVSVDRADHALRLTVSDNGSGFSFRGRHDLEMLEQARMGPLKLRERVRALQGTLLIDSREDGARIEITVPATVPQLLHADPPRSR